MSIKVLAVLFQSREPVVFCQLIAEDRGVLYCAKLLASSTVSSARRGAKLFLLV